MLLKIKLINIICVFLLSSISACGQITENTSSINITGMTVEKRFIPPLSYKGIELDPNTFQFYLRSLPLKSHSTKVKFYNGIIKPNYWVYEAVVDIDVGERNLQQCADAVMRLKAEYLYKSEQFDKIHFNFTNGFRVDYSEWMKGKRIVVEGNKTYWKDQASPSNTYHSFRKYMNIIFAYAGTLSLSNEMISVDIKNIQIGDVFIQGGSPGHAVIVVDMAIDSNQNKVFLLAQSYMPAQDIQILVNPDNRKLSPWYNLDFEGDLVTPEWTFKKSDLKRFKD
ncbi:MAG: DUF4846 domain-containing protein [Bacteroidales bacterium]|nr:DUF4846 domain-containing protein [Bacteroidales bacterium]